jgi:soluble lytic murein transglycosylase
LNPFSISRNWRTRTPARFLRGRILFEIARYKEALADFTDVSSLRSSIDKKEALMWKARTLEKMGRTSDSREVYRKLSNGTDFFAIKATEALGATPRSSQTYTAGYMLCKLPDSSKEDQIKSRIDAGDLLPALLYLHLFEEASNLLPDVSPETWKLLEINGNDRLERFLGLTQLAALGQDFATATYYSELFLKALPKSIPVFSLPKEILQVLFPVPYKDSIVKFSKERNVDPLLVLSIMKQESRFKRFARSGAFARGLMQLIPETAGKIATALGLVNFEQNELYLPDVAINIGTKYIQDMTKEFGPQVEILAAGYNAGELNLRRWLSTSTPGETLDFFSNIDASETKKYVMIVKTNYETYKKIYGSL